MRWALSDTGCTSSESTTANCSMIATPCPGVSASAANVMSRIVWSWHAALAHLQVQAHCEWRQVHADSVTELGKIGAHGHKGIRRGHLRLHDIRARSHCRRRLTLRRLRVGDGKRRARHLKRRLCGLGHGRGRADPACAATADEYTFKRLCTYTAWTCGEGSPRWDARALR